MPDILRAILLMVVGSFFFMVGDMFLKFSTETLPLGLVTILRRDRWKKKTTAFCLGQPQHFAQGRRQYLA